MIFARRICVDGTMTLQSDLHIGGSNVKRDEKDHQIAMTVRGGGNLPIIPASSLKGVLSSAFKCINPELAATLFGEGSVHEEGVGKTASLWLDHARFKEPGEELEGLSANPVSNGVFRAKHVALDPKTGAAEDHKLFEREMVGAGATFSFGADFFGENIMDLAPVLALLCDGIQLGRGTTKGNGRISLDPTTIGLTEFVPQEDGKLKEVGLDASELYEAIEAIGPAAAPASRTITLKLLAQGPFLSVRKIGGTNQNNEMLPLKRDCKPFLWPESLVGALRNRARWVAAIAAPNDADIDNPDRKRAPQDMCCNSLTDTEKLFGVSGRKGCLSVRSLICISPGNQVKFTRNSIDRFTGATRDKALFSTQAFWQPEFLAVLEVKGNHHLLGGLLNSLKTEGMELGHGASIGYGWFKVEVADDGN